MDEELDNKVKEVISELEQRDYSDEENALEAAIGDMKLVSERMPLEVPNLGKVWISSPNFKIQAEVEKFKATQRFKVMKECPELPTKKQVLKVLEERGIWGKEEMNRVDDMIKELSELEKTFKDVASPTKGRKQKNKEKALAEKIVKIRQEKARLDLEYQEYMNNTVEGIVANLCQYYLFWLCIQNEDGSPFWSTLDEMLSQLDESTVTYLFTEAIKYMAGLRTDF